MFDNWADTTLHFPRAVALPAVVEESTAMGFKGEREIANHSKFKFRIIRIRILNCLQARSFLKIDFYFLLKLNAHNSDNLGKILDDILQLHIFNFVPKFLAIWRIVKY